MPSKVKALKADQPKAEKQVEVKTDKPVPPDYVPSAEDYSADKHANHSHLNP